MSKFASEVSCRVEKCQIVDGECTVCSIKTHNKKVTQCSNGHKIDAWYGIINGRKPFSVVQCSTDGTRCTICGAQVPEADTDCANGHQVGSFYEIN